MPVKLKSRLMFFYDEDIAKQKHCISPQKYFPSTKLEQNLRFKNITFGIGKRTPNEITCNNKDLKFIYSFYFYTRTNL